MALERSIAAIVKRGELLLPGAPRNRACLFRQRGPFRYRWHLYDRPDNGGYHTEQKDSLYTSVDPISPPPQRSEIVDLASDLISLVEAPGTAPGSGPLITQPFIAIVRLP